LQQENADRGDGNAQKPQQTTAYLSSCFFTSAAMSLDNAIIKRYAAHEKVTTVAIVMSTLMYSK
jgi:hypothetical protein